MESSGSVMRKLHESICGILQQYNFGKASVLIRHFGEALEYRTYTRCDHNGHDNYCIDEDADPIYHVHSLTQPLVAVAWNYATEAEVDEPLISKNIYSCGKLFGPRKVTSCSPGRTKDAPFPFLAGYPAIAQLLVHIKGVRPTSDPFLCLDCTRPITALDLFQNSETLNFRPLKPYEFGGECWFSHSELNYALVAVAIETMWKGYFKDFMSQALFRPFGMVSEKTTLSEEFTEQGYLSLSDDFLDHDVLAAAHGTSFSCLSFDRFLNTLMLGFHDISEVPGVNHKFMDKVLKYESRARSGIYTALGNYTTVGQGSIESYGLDDPEGCSFRFSPHIKKEKCFYVVVLTDSQTDAAKAVSQLVLDHFSSRSQSRAFERFSNKINKVFGNDYGTEECTVGYGERKTDGYKPEESYDVIRQRAYSRQLEEWNDGKMKNSAG